MMLPNTLVRLASAAAAMLLVDAADAQTSRQIDQCNSATYEEQIRACNAVIEAGLLSGPNLANAYLNRGVAYRYLNNYPQAVRNYDEALRIDPSLISARIRRCWARAVLGNLQEALVDCEESMRVQPDRLSYSNMAFIALKLGRFDAALFNYENAVRLDPDNPYALYGRGITKLRLGDELGGTNDIRRATAIQPDIAEEFTAFSIQK
jgi:tetratricopeptide (TPR) repeat protein